MDSRAKYNLRLRKFLNLGKIGLKVPFSHLQHDAVCVLLKKSSLLRRIFRTIISFVSEKDVSSIVKCCEKFLSIRTRKDGLQTFSLFK